MNLKEASTLLNIHPRTKQALAAWEKAEIMSDLPYQVKYAAQGITYAIRTGRLVGGVEIALRQASPYQQLKVLVSVINEDLTQAKVAAFLNSSTI